MLKKLTVINLLWVLGAAAAPPPEKPRLVVAIAVDQLRYDYLTRFRTEYKGGFDRLLTRGAVFTNARYEHFPTVTAIGHSTFLTGATPSISGIVGNDWYDREEGRTVTSVSDPKVELLGGAGGAGASPRRLLVSTVGDELKMAGGKSRVIGISLQGPQRHPPRRPHGQRRLLVRQQERQFRQQHVLLRRPARLGQGLQLGAPRRPLPRRAMAEPQAAGRARKALPRAGGEPLRQ